MSGSPAPARRRYRLIEDVLDEVRRSGRPVVPAALRGDVDAEFGDLDGLLLAVARRWHTAFVAHLDAVLEDDPADLPAAVAELWQSQARTHAGSVALLDAHADRPVLVDARNRLQRDVLAATGVEPTRPRYHATTGSTRLAAPRYRAKSGSATGRRQWKCRIRAATGSARPDGGPR